MRRSLYPDGVLVDRTVLEYSELSKAGEILRNRLDWTSRGIFSGGAITVGAVDDTRIDIAAFSGFAPNGEFVECTGNLMSIQLDSSVLNAVNYVCAFYTETQNRNQTHETDGQTYATRAIGSYRVRVYEESNFLALASTDANLANDAQDRALLLGKVTGNGAGVTLTTSNIFGPTVYNNILYAEPRVPTLIPGVTIIGVSPDTSTGTGTLDYAIVGLNSQLTWTSASGAGAAVTISADGNYNLLDALGEYITVYCVFSQLSTTTPLSESIEIIDLYEQEIPRVTAEDFLHRNMTGSGLPSENNPHGMTIDDLSGSDFSLLAEHRDTQHGIGLYSGSSPAALTCSIAFPVGADVLNIINLSGPDILYLNGEKVQSVSPLSYSIDPSVIPASASGTHFLEVGVDDNGASYVTTKMSFPDPRAVPGCWIVDASENYPVGGGSANLALTVTNPGVFTYSFVWDSGEAVVLTATDEPQVIRLFAANAQDWIDLWVNCASGEANPDANPPPVIGVYSDVITIFPSEDPSQNMRIASFPIWLDAFAAPPRCAAGYPGYGLLRSIVDKRQWGTLDKSNISDTALENLVYSPQDELHYSGVLYSRNATHGNFEIYNVAALTFSIRGGAYYCRGERIDFAGDASVTLVDNTVNLVYLDTSGTIGLLDVTADFAGDMADAILYLTGQSKLLPETHLSQYPERGVPLYEIITAGGVISSTYNVMRNINGPVDPWSVAEFATHALPISAFDTLYAAFLYASNLDGSTLTITLTGSSSVSRRIVQPQGTNVRGQSQDAALVIYVIDATGAWELSSGCRVDDVYIFMFADGGVAIKPASNCTISRCKYSTFFVNGEVFVKSTTAVSNVLVEACDITTRSGAVVLTHASNTQIRVKNLSLVGESNNSGLGHGLIDLCGEYLDVSGCQCSTSNSVDFTPAIQIEAGSSFVFIEDNEIKLGDGDYSASEVGIKLLSGLTSSKISHNKILRIVGETGEGGIGILLTGGAEDVSISNNSITSLGVGISLQTSAISASWSNIQVCENKFQTCYHRGIDLDVVEAHDPTLSGIFVSGNQLYNFTKGTVAGGLALWGNSLLGIVLAVEPDVVNPHLVSLSGISFVSNQINGLTNVAAGTISMYALCSVGAADSAYLVGLNISDNNILSFSGADGSSALGIYTYFSNMDLTSGVSISGNTISASSSATNVASTVCGIINYLDDAVIGSNNINMYGTTTSRRCNGIESSANGVKIDGNFVTANWTGISNTGVGCTINGNTVESYGVGILNAVVSTRCSISTNRVSTTTINSVTTSVQPAASCGCIVSGGGFCNIDSNVLMLYGTGAGDVPNHSALIYVSKGPGTSVKNNNTTLGSSISTISGGAPTISAGPGYTLVNYACHIYFGFCSAIHVVWHGDVSGNYVDNYTSNSGVFGGIYLADENPGMTIDVFGKFNSNFIRGKSDSGAKTVPQAIPSPPFEYYSNIDVDGASSRWVVSTGNEITSEDLAYAAGNCPSIYFQGAHIPKAGFGTYANMATNVTNPSLLFW